MEGAPPARWAHLGWASLGARLAIRPDLWPTAARQAVILRAPAWRRFRLETQYGTADRAPAAADAIEWLAWCRSWRRSVPRPTVARTVVSPNRRLG